MHWYMQGNTPRISAGFYLTLALMLLVMPLRWLVAAIFAAIFHEFCHYAVIRILCGTAANVRIYSYGARMPLPEMERWKELLCALAGPAGGCLLLALSPFFPRLAVCAMVQTAYNLLPIYPLDGGRALACALSMFSTPPKAAVVMSVTGYFVRSLVVMLGLYGTFFLKMGLMPLLLTAVIIIRTK